MSPQKTESRSGSVGGRRAGTRSGKPSLAITGVIAAFALVVVALVAVALRQSATPAASGAGQGQEAAQGPAGAAAGAGMPAAVSQQLSQLKSAVGQYEAEVKLRPQDPQAWVQLGNANYDLGVLYMQADKGQQAQDYLNAAISAYEKALQQDPNNVAVRTDLATAAFYVHRDDLAQQNFQRVIAVNPQYANARYNYGVFLLHARHDSRGALEQWRQALRWEQDPARRTSLQDMIRQLEQMLAAPNAAGSAGSAGATPSGGAAGGQR